MNAIKWDSFGSGVLLTAHQESIPDPIHDPTVSEHNFIGCFNMTSIGFVVIVYLQLIKVPESKSEFGLPRRLSGTRLLEILDATLNGTEWVIAR